MDLYHLLIILLIGAVAGWLAGKIVKGFGLGLVGNIVVGVIGAFVGSWVLGRLGLAIGNGPVDSVVKATIGAVLVLLLFGIIKRL